MLIISAKNLILLLFVSSAVIGCSRKKSGTVQPRQDRGTVAQPADQQNPNDDLDEEDQEDQFAYEDDQQDQVSGDSNQPSARRADERDSRRADERPGTPFPGDRSGKGSTTEKGDDD